MLNHFSILQYSIPGRQNNRISGQTGVSHPQCPEMKMYKVLKEVVETTSSGTKGETEMKVGGRVRSSSMKELLSKQLKVGLDSLESQAHMDLKTGTIKNKKEKKAKSPAQLALAEVKQLHNKLLNLHYHYSRRESTGQETLQHIKQTCSIPHSTKVEEVPQRDPQDRRGSGDPSSPQLRRACDLEKISSSRITTELFQQPCTNNR